jgi:hypothetical protein
MRLSGASDRFAPSTLPSFVANQYDNAMHHLRSTIAIAVLVAPLAAIPRSATGQRAIPIRPLGAIQATSTASFDTIVSVRGLSDGRVIVNDLVGLHLIMLDASLTKSTVIADTGAAAPKPYGNRPNSLIRFTGDSSVFLDIAASAMVVIDPAGNFTRVMSPPKPRDLGLIASSSLYGSSAFDPKGRIIYRATPFVPPFPVGCTGSPTAPTFTLPDSAPLVRGDFETRAVDTIAQIKLVLQGIGMAPGEPGCWVLRQKQDVLPFHGDDWTMLADGTLAIVREGDYHVDWMSPDGHWTATPKMPFDWRRLTQEEKLRMIDSATHIADSVAQARLARAPAGTKAQPALPTKLDEIPEFYPPLKLGSMRVDLEGNLWILPATTRSANGGLLYDIVNRKGEIVRRVQMPPGRAVGAFVPGGVILTHRDGKRVFIERARIQ